MRRFATHGCRHMPSPPCHPQAEARTPLGVTLSEAPRDSTSQARCCFAVRLAPLAQNDAGDEVEWVSRPQRCAAGFDRRAGACLPPLLYGDAFNENRNLRSLRGLEGTPHPPRVARHLLPLEKAFKRETSVGSRRFPPLRRIAKLFCRYSGEKNKQNKAHRRRPPQA